MHSVEVMKWLRGECVATGKSGKKSANLKKASVKKKARKRALKKNGEAKSSKGK